MLDLEPGSKIGTAVLVGTYEDGSPEWHAQRAKVIGGSEAGTVLGINDFQSAYMLWYSKAGFIVEDFSEEKLELFEWGHRLEVPIALKFADEHPEYEVARAGSFVHEEHTWRGYNPDRLLVDENGEVVGILEIKSSKSGFGWEQDMCPMKYVAQLRHGLDVFGLDVGYLVVLASLGEYREYMVPRDPNFPVISVKTGREEWYSVGGQEAFDAEFAFYQSLPGQLTEEGTPPPIDGSKGTFDLIKKQHPDIVAKGEGSEIQVDPAMVQWADLAITNAKYWASEELRVKGEIVAHMDKARIALCGDKKFARRQSVKGGTPFLVFY